MLVKCAKFEQDLRIYGKRGLADEIGYLRYVFYTLACRLLKRFVNIEDYLLNTYQDVVYGQRLYMEFPDFALFDAAQAALGNAIAVYETWRVKPWYHERAKKRDYENYQAIANMDIAAASAADMAEMTLKKYLDYVYGPSVYLGKRYSKDILLELVQTAAMAGEWLWGCDDYDG